MSEIEKAKDEVLNQLSDSGKEKLNQAFIDLENGEIDRVEYANILKEQLANGIEEGTMSEGFLTDFVTYLDENKGDIAKGTGKDAIVAALEQAGLATIRQNGKIVINEGVKGPKGDKSFVMVDKEVANKSNKYSNSGKWLGRVGKGLGGGLAVWGLWSGYREDTIENNKTAGEAIAHNGASFGVGAVAAGATTLFLASNPVGWAAVGAAATVIAAGTIVSVGFEFLYDSIPGIQDGLDWVGGKIDKAGEAISDGLSAINPMNWAW